MASREGLVRRVSQKRSFGAENACAAARSYCFRGADGEALLFQFEQGIAETGMVDA